MVILSSPTGLLEIGIFLLAILAFVLAVRFFMDSRKRLAELFPGIMSPGKLLPFGFDRSGFVIPKSGSKKTENISSPLCQPLSTAPDITKEEIKNLRTQLHQQQQELSKALEKITLIGQRTGNAENRRMSFFDEQQKGEQWQVQSGKKEAETQRLRQQEVLSSKLQERFEEVQSELEAMQVKMVKMEKQAWQAAELTIQLEHAEQSELQMEKLLAKKDEKLRELTLENQQLRDTVSRLEDNLSQANLQRQQLLKKVQYLQEVNADMLQLAEANRKLKLETPRVAELESMLELITEERKTFLNRR